jgi:hypothetical protein
MCYHVYVVPKPAPKRRKRRPVTATEEKPVEEPTEQSEEE